MTRKRFIKLMRSHGFNMEYVNDLVKWIQEYNYASYKETYEHEIYCINLDYVMEFLGI